MKNIFVVLLFLLFLGADLFAEDSPTSLADAFKQGNAYLSLRYRFENVDQDRFAKNADASTLRTRLGFETAEYEDFKALLEIEDVQTVGNALYNDTLNGKTDYPVVADPDSTEINQAYLAYSGITDTALKIGRRLLTLDDHRFVGDVDWRQNSQTFDAVDVLNTSIEDTTLYYAWINQVNRIFGEDSDKGKFDSQVHLFNVKNKSFKDIDLTGFLYLMDLENAAALSNTTFGFRANGQQILTEALNLLFDASYAHQSDYADNPQNISADYYHISSGLKFNPATLQVGYEVLGSDGGQAAFQTPLATLHKFNGWADMFLSTPANGLQDFYTKLDFDLKEIIGSGAVFSAIFHDFTANHGSDHYGNEWDFVLSKKISEYYSVAAHYADYNAIDFANDTQKFWLSLSAAWGA